MIHPCILSGGAGTRLWPQSRNYAPKQLQALLSDRSMIRDTALRFHRQIGFSEAVVICNETYSETIAKDFSSGDPKLAALIAEPGRRDTAAAAALAAFHVRNMDPEGYVLLLPSDHHIRKPQAFVEAIRTAARSASASINTFGIVPTRPDTGFGYIRRDDKAEKRGALFPVDAFVEKPDAKTAQTYLDAGTYYWNAGIFLFRPDTFLSELKRFQPGIHKVVEQSWAERHVTTAHDTSILTPSNRFLDCDGISLDYAVMEKTGAATVMPVDIGWDDLGSWAAVRDLHGRDKEGNVARGDAYLFDCSNVYVESHSRLVVATGVSNLIVVDTPDALLVCDASATQEVKTVHGKLVEMGRAEADYHRDGSSRRIGLRCWYRDWLTDHALPFWVDTAIDPRTNIPHEAMSYTGQPLDETVRSRVLSRQIFSYAFAAERFNWDADRAAHIIARLCDAYVAYVRAGKGLVARIDRSGSVVDDCWDTYDQAFHILAMAWAYRATREDRYAALGEAALEELRTVLKHPTRGYLEDAAASLPRRANPHMHLLEAALAWLPTDRKGRFAPIAEEMVTLFRHNFCRNGLLFERLDDGLGSIDDPKATDAIEPGHLYEWATLLKMAARATIRSTPDSPAETAGMTAAMVGFADAYGRNRETGLVYDSCSADGLETSGTHRLWAQTEMVRHHLHFGTPTQQSEALSTLETIKTLYLEPGNVKGLWRDKLSHSLQDLSERAPASTLYHMMGMIDAI